MKDKIAILLWFLHVPYNSSTGIDGSDTRGYGKLDDYGFWEYEILYKRSRKHYIIGKMRNCVERRISSILYNTRHGKKTWDYYLFNLYSYVEFKLRNILHKMD